MSFNNNYVVSSKSACAAENDYSNNSKPFLGEKQQNDVNAREEAGDRSYGIRCGRSQFLRSRRVAVAACVAVTVVLVIGLVAILALVVVVGLMNGQSSHLRSLQDEVAALRIQNDVLRNQTALLESRASVCRNDLQRVNHLLELSDTKCGVEKANLSTHFQFELRNVRADMEAVERNLSECREQTRVLNEEKAGLESDKASLTERVDGCGREKGQLEDTVTQLRSRLDNVERNLSECRDQTRVLTEEKAGLESDKASLRERVDGCGREKDQLRSRLDNARCPPCPSSDQRSYSLRGNSASGLCFSRILLLFAILLAVLPLIR